MSQLTLEDIRQMLGSNKIKFRVVGYGQMQAYLSNSDNVASMSDKDCLRAAKTIGTAVILEQEGWWSSVTKDSTGDRLVISGGLLKKLVDLTQDIMKSQTLRYIIQHFQSMLVRSNEICTPLLIPYSKICLTICQHPAHLEQLAHNEWSEFAEFISATLQLLIEEQSSKQPLRVSPSMVDMLSALELILQGRSSAIPKIFRNILPSLHLFLATFKEETAGHAIVFASLNHILLATSINKIDITQKIALLGLDHVENLLECKYQILRQNIYLFICHSYYALFYLLMKHTSSPDNDSGVEDIYNLLVGIFKRLAAQPVSNAISVEDIYFADSSEVSLLKFELFKMSPHGNFTKWLYTLASARLAMLCSFANNIDSNPNKRRKTLTGNKSYQAVDVLTFLLSQDTPKQALYFQILAISAQEWNSDPDSCVLLLEILIPYCSSVDSTVASWAMICCGCVLNSSSDEHSIHGLQDVCSSLWDRAVKKLFEAKSSAATIFLVQRLLSSSLLSNDSQASELEGFLNLWDTHTPSLSYSSLSLCQTVLSLKSSSPSLIRLAHTKLLEWLLGAWQRDIYLPRIAANDMHVSVGIAQTLALLAGYQTNYQNTTDIYWYSGVEAYNDLKSTKLIETWRYLSMDATPAGNTSNTNSTSIVTGPVSASNQKSIVSHCSGLLKSLQNSTDAVVQHGQKVHCLVTCLLLLHTLESNAEHSESSRLAELFQEVCNHPPETQIVQSDEVAISALHDVTAALSKLETNIALNPISTACFISLANSIIEDLENVYKLPESEDLSEVKLITGDCQVISTSYLAKLRSPDSLRASKKIQRTQWLINLRLVLQRVNVPDDMRANLTDLICSLSTDDLIAWLPVLIKDADEHNDIYDFNEVQYRPMLRAIGQKVFGSYTWKKSEIAMVVVLQFVARAWKIWVTPQYIEEDGDARIDGSTQTDVEDLVAYISLYMRQIEISPFSVKIAMISLIATILKRNLMFKFKIFDVSARAQLISLVREDDDVFYYHATPFVADLLVNIAPLSQQPLYRDVFSISQKNLTTNSIALRVRSIWVLTEKGFTISLLICHLVEYATFPDVQGYVAVELTKILHYLKIRTARDLFKRLMPILLKNWFEIHSDFSGFPFQLCGYDSETEFQQENFSDALSQLVNKQTKGLDINVTSNSIGIVESDIYEAIYARCFAYALTSDDIADEPMQDFLINTVKIPLSKVDINLPDIFAEILILTDLSEIPDRLLSLEPFSKIGKPRRLGGWWMKSIPVDLSLRAIDELCELYSDENYLSYFQDKPVFLRVLSRLLDFDPFVIEPVERYLRLRQAMLLLALSRNYAFKSYPVLDITIRGFSPWIEDPEAGEEVAEIVVWLLQAGIEGFAANLLQFVRLIIWMLGLFDDSSKVPTSRVVEFLQVSVLPKVFEQQTEILNDKDSNQLSRILNIFVENSLSPSMKLTSEDMIFIVDFPLIQLRDLAQMISKQIEVQPDLILEKVDRIDLPLVYVEKLYDDLGFYNGGTVESRAWLGRVLASAYMQYGRIRDEQPECKIEQYENNVVAKIVSLVIEQVETGNIQMISAGRQSLQQLIFCGPRVRRDRRNESALQVLFPEELFYLVNTEQRVVFTPSDRALHPLPELPYEEWVKNICMNFLPYVADRIPGAQALNGLVKLSANFSDNLLPIMMQVEWGATGEDIQLICYLLSFYLKPSRNFTSMPRDYNRKREKMLQVLCSLRRVELKVEGPLSLFDAATTAYEIGMYKTALMLLELSQFESVSIELRDDLLASICGAIVADDPDLKYLATTTPSLSKSIGLREDEGSSWYSLSYQSALFDDRLSSKMTSNSLGELATAFDHIGMQGLTKVVSEWSDGLLISGDMKNSYAWKAQQWDLPVVTNGSPTENEVLFRMFKSLESLASSAKLYDQESDTTVSLFNRLYADLYPLSPSSLSTMGTIRDCERIFSIQPAYGSDEDLLETFVSQKNNSSGWMNKLPYKDIENLLLARQVAWKIRSQYAPTGEKDSYNYCLALSLADNARHAWKGKQSHKALASTVQLRTLAKFYIDPSQQMVVRTAATAAVSNVIWHTGNQSHSINMMRSAIVPAIPFDERSSYWWEFYNDLEGLCRLAEWSSVARSGTNEKIRSDFLEPAVNMIEELKSKVPDSTLESSAAIVHHSFAVFCDSQLEDGTLQNELDILERQCSQKGREIEAFKVIYDRSSASEKSDIQRHLKKVTKLYDMDKRELAHRQRLRTQLLNKAIESYLQSIILGDKYSEDTSRFFALWLAHLNDLTVNATVAKYLPSVASTKFVPWINQLASLLTFNKSKRSGSSQKASFVSNVHSLIIRLCTDHPHHCLYQVLSLRMVPADDTDELSIQRSKAGSAVWKQLERQKIPHLTKILSGIEVLVLKILRLTKLAKEAESATQQDPSGGTRRKLTTKKQKVKRTKLNFDELADAKWWLQTGLGDTHLPPPSFEIPLRADCDYSSVPTMIRVDNQIKLASGLSRPMIVKSYTSDGESSTMVMKSGIDDLRQDAIMEQVFEHVNNFLRQNENTLRRNLKIRTYRVVPLSPQVGVIEFVDNAVALADILEPLHTKYRPQDITIDQARRMMSDVQLGPIPTRIKVYNKIEENLKPVLSKIFLERFFSPDDWFRARTRYTRSNATASILGFVIGLGDRHCRNIMLDVTTGEIVHIDLGIAFDQAKVLRIPETVPFRLTRDMVDGMGIVKTAGTFQRCCELTLDVLRDEVRSVTTIVNVLKYDPLYSWTLTPLRKKLQQEMLSSRNTVQEAAVAAAEEEGEEALTSSVSEADQALESVRRKLSRNLSSEAMTRELIQQATSPKNLGLIYYGWCPFL